MVLFHECNQGWIFKMHVTSEIFLPLEAEVRKTGNFFFFKERKKKSRVIVLVSKGWEILRFPHQFFTLMFFIASVFLCLVYGDGTINIQS